MIKGYTASAHVIHDRMDRVTTIAESIGFGKPIYFAAHTKTATDRSVIITDSGVVFITNPIKKVIVTLYVGQFEQIYGVTHGSLSRNQYNAIKKNIDNYHRIYGVV